MAQHGWRAPPASSRLPTHVACLLQALVDYKARLDAHLGAARASNDSSSSSGSNGSDGGGRGHGNGLSGAFLGTAPAPFGHLAGAALSAVMTCAEARLAANAAGRSGGSGRGRSSSSCRELPPLSAGEALARAAEVAFLTDALLPYAARACKAHTPDAPREVDSPGGPRGGGTAAVLAGSASVSGVGFGHVAAAHLTALEARARAAAAALATLADAPVEQLHARVADMREYAAVYLACFA
jgi:hypothetical protein